MEGGVRSAPRGQAGCVAVTVVIFTVRDGSLSVLLIHRAADPFAGWWALPGGLLLAEETLDQAAARKLLAETGVSDVYLEQLYTFDAPHGVAPATPVVAYFALVDINRVHLEERPSWTPAWFPVCELPELAFENDAIVRYALKRLRAKLGYSNVVYSLLPERFTLSQLQSVYEAIVGHPLDKRNFRKRILSLGFLSPTGETRLGGAHRPAHLYRFSQREPLTF
jgi:8-oxo-dGTP diphosphatase